MISDSFRCVGVLNFMTISAVCGPRPALSLGPDIAPVTNHRVWSLCTPQPHPGRPPTRPAPPPRDDAIAGLPVMPSPTLTAPATSPTSKQRHWGGGGGEQ